MGKLIDKRLNRGFGHRAEKIWLREIDAIIGVANDQTLAIGGKVCPGCQRLQPIDMQHQFAGYGVAQFG